MKNLIQGIVEFRQNLTPEHRKLFAKLALGQKPNAFFVACSDSRVVPNLFASTNPGDLFISRNIGNLMPPYSPELVESCAQAALEFSIFNLEVADVIICGHSECGAMQTLAYGLDTSCCPHVADWLRHGADSLALVREGFGIDKTLSVHNQVSQANVLLQIEHMKTYPFVQERLAKNKLRIHGWWFDIAQADVYCFEPKVNRFVLIDDDEGQLIIDRMQ